MTYGWKELEGTKLLDTARIVEDAGYKGLGLSVVPTIPAMVGHENFLLLGRKGTGKSATLSFISRNFDVDEGSEIDHLITMHFSRPIKTVLARELRRSVIDAGIQIEESEKNWEKIVLGERDFVQMIVDDLGGCDDYSMNFIIRIVGKMGSEEVLYEGALDGERIEWMFYDTPFWFASTCQPRIFNKLWRKDIYRAMSQDRFFYYPFFNPFPELRDYKDHHPDLVSPISMSLDLPPIKDEVEESISCEIIANCLRKQGITKARSFRISRNWLLGLHGYEGLEEFDKDISRGFTKVVRQPLIAFSDMFWKHGEGIEQTRSMDAGINHLALELFLYYLEEGGWEHSNKEISDRLKWSRSTLGRAKTFLYDRGLIAPKTWDYFLSYFDEYSNVVRGTEFNYHNHEFRVTFPDE